MQYAFDFSPGRPGYGALVIGPANRRVVERLQEDAAWPGAWLCLVGPPRSGRTTLARIWAGERDGCVLDPAGFAAAPQSALDLAAAGRLALDDSDGIADEDRLLHVLNLARNTGGRVLLTASAAPADWPVRQPDLASRLRAMSVMTIEPPGEEMVRDLLEAACHRRHFGLPDDVWSYLSRRVARDYAALDALAEELCAAVSGTGRGLTVPVARQVMGEGAGDEADGEEEDD